MVGCKKDDDIIIEGEVGDNGGFCNSFAYEVGEDGWVYTMILEYPQERTTNDTYVYAFDGINTKYLTMENNGTRICDENGEILEISPNATPCLSLSLEYGDKIMGLNDYFIDKSFKREITLEDINDLDMGEFDKNIIVRLYNEAYKATAPEKLGDYGSMPNDNAIREADYVDDYVWHVNYIQCFGYLKKVTIQLVTKEDGKEIYLCDKIIDGTATDEEQQIQKELENIENSIVENQDFTSIDCSSTKIGKYDFSRLYKILEHYENKETAMTWENNDFKDE